MTTDAERPEAAGERVEIRLWRAHGDVVGRVCRALLDGDAARVLAAVEGTFTRAFASDALKEAPLDGERAWLCAIARAECARITETGAAVTCAERGTSDVTTSEDASPDRARALLAGLKPTERDAVVLWRIAGLSLAETGRACGVDEATARARVNKALRRLRLACADT